MVYIQGTKKLLNERLKGGEDLRTVEYGKAERHSMLSEYPTGTDISIWQQNDAERKPIVKAYGVYNKVKNKIE